MPKGVPKSGKRNRQSKRDDILDAAMRVFCHYGFFGATVEKIAREAGVSPGLVMQHGGSKDELAATCVRQFMSRFSERMKKLASREGLSYRDNVDHIFELFKINRREMQFIINILCTPALGDLAREINNTYLGVAHEIVSGFEEEIADGATFELAYAMTAMYFSYVIGGSEANYLRSRNALLARFLK